MKNLQRGYQHGFSESRDYVFESNGRKQKAVTMINVFENFLSSDLSKLRVLNVGGSTGIIDSYLANYFKHITVIDIDLKAIEYAKEKFQNEKLVFQVGDAMNLDFEDNLFDVIICAHVYEHVPSAEILFNEIYRTLKPGGLVYFSAGNRIMFNEPHYNLPLLSIFPRAISDIYIKLAGKADYYHEKHYTYWGLKKLAKRFKIHDYTLQILANPRQYKVEYLVKPGSFKQKIACFVTRFFIWLVPGYIWLLQKPENDI